MSMENDSTNRMLTLTINNINYLIPVSNVDSVVSIRKDSISSVPFDEMQRIRGIFNYKGTVIAIANCHGLNYDCFAKKQDNVTAIILKHENMQFAILVDHADEVVENNEKSEKKVLDVEKLYLGELQVN